MTILILVSGFFAVLCIALGLGLALQKFQFEDTQTTVRQGHALLSSPVGPFISRRARRINRGKSAKRAANMSQKLIFAGRPAGDLSGAEFMAVSQMSAIGVALVTLFLSVTSSGLSLAMIILPALVGGAVLLFVTAWLDSAVADRRREISLSFPYFMDLAVMTMEAGADFRESVTSYINDNKDDALAEELSITLNEMKMGRVFQEAMSALASRISAEEVVSIIRTIMQGDRMGTPLGQVFRDQSDTLRFQRSQMAERAAEEMKVKLQGPAMLLMVSVLVLILGPALIDMFSSDFF